MKIAFDTNVILDAIMERPESANAIRLTQAVIEEKLIGVVSANTITDIYYIARKNMSENNAKEAIREILTIFEVAPID